MLQTNFNCATQLAGNHHIYFDSFVDETIPRWVSVDAMRLQQILNNLISNAFKFTPQGGHIQAEVPPPPCLS